MKKFISKLKDNPALIVSIILFFSFLAIGFFSPITGDDWGNFMKKSFDFLTMWRDAVDMYKTWEGRFISRILISFFTSNGLIWSFINALVISGSYYFTSKMINPKRKLLIALLLMLGFLIIEREIFTQVYIWRAGNITYMFSAFLIIAYLYYISRVLNKCLEKIKTYKFILLILFNFLATMFVENSAMCLIFINFLALIYHLYKYKVINIQLITYLAASILGFSIMYFSPGNVVRIIEETAFTKLPLLEKVVYNVPNFIQWTFIENPFTILLFLIAMDFMIIKRFDNIKRFVLLLYVNIFPIIKFICLVFSINLNYNNFEILYWISFLFLFIYLILIHFKGKYREKIVFYLLIALSSNVFMLMSPIWGGRTTALTVLLLYIPLFMIVRGIPIKEKIVSAINKLLITVISFVIIILLVAYYNIMLASNYRDKSIEKQISLGNNTIIVSDFPYYLLYDPAPIDEFHISVFKKYYNIPEQVTIKKVDNNWKFFIIYNESKEMIAATNKKEDALYE